MNVPEEYVPAETPADHWSKSAEWLEYKRKQDEMRASPEWKADEAKLHKLMSVGTITPETRKKSTHEIQMEACRVEWVDPNPPEEYLKTEAEVIAAVDKLKQAHVAFTDAVLEEMAKEILDRISRATEKDESPLESGA
jgi:hypothetical protein